MAGWKVLTPHGTARPAEHHEPIGQASQSLSLIRFLLRPTFPASHAVGAELPAAHQDDIGQGSHICSPSLPWKLPAAHLSHAPMLAWGATVPGLHGAWSVLPNGEKWPLSVGVHSPGLVRLVAFEYVPSSHGSGALAPSGQNEPGVHGSQTVWASFFWYVPASHLSHVPLPALGWTVPGNTAEAGEIAPRATGARYSPHAPRIAVVALLACGRSDSGRCSTHVAGRATR
eukprot:scaffold4244_cov69-Phaeocystis_antarctica.AAC.3